MQTVLFLCSGNFYRSRFAEHLFNHLAATHNLDWQATSGGLAVAEHLNNVGPISPLTIAALQARDIAIPNEFRDPHFIEEVDLAHADLIVAVKNTEHRPMLAERFPGWEDSVRFWEIHDLDCAGAEEALPALETHVATLIEELILRSSA